MKTSSLVHFSSALKASSNSSQLAHIKSWIVKAPGIGCLYFLSFALAAIGIGSTASRSVAQVTYYDRPISYNPNTGYVSTSSGIGLNVRSGPGLSYPIIGGAEDGNFVDLTGGTVSSDGYTWRRVSTGGWVATEYVNGGLVNISSGNGCMQEVSYGCGGDSVPVTRPVVYRPVVYRPVAVTTPMSAGPYVAAVPGGASTLAQVRRIVPTAQLDRAREGSFVNAGGFATHDGAQSLTSLLRANGFDARVIYK